MRGAAVVLCLSACAGAPPSPAGPARASGQSALIGQTVAGKGACEPEDHLRPFVVEWDATDLSSFEAKAATDVVFVRYSGCKLEVLDECASESVRGALGAYGAVSWTSGALESVDIQSELELYAKLPLGVATLGGRAASGEKFHMEYFVAGTRKATRAAVYQEELAAIPGCKGATHFVHAYQLGAFVLGSLTRAEAEAGATLWGIGGGVGAGYASAIEKRGGKLEACSAESAREIQGCKAPIRLTLRGVSAGANPDATAAVAPETPDALNLAGKLQAAADRSNEVGERLRAANDKLNAGDGKGCLAELDAADQLQKKGADLSTEPTSYVAMTRGRCLMVAGQCDAGKSLLRRSQERLSTSNAPEQLDRMVDSFVGMHCSGPMSPRDRLLRALWVLSDGAFQRTIDAKLCAAELDAALKVLPDVKAAGPNDAAVQNVRTVLLDQAQRCLSRAGDCAGAYAAFKKVGALIAAADRASFYADPRSIVQFVSTTREACLEKPIAQLSPLETLYRAAEELELRGAGTAWTSARCKRRVEEGAAAYAAITDKGQAARSALAELRENGLECLAKLEDCDAALDVTRALLALEDPAPRHPSSLFAALYDDAKICEGVRPKRLSLEESLSWIHGRIEREARVEAPDAALCRSIWGEFRAGWRPEHVDTAKNPLFGHTADRAARCLAKGGDCAAAWQVFGEYVGHTWKREADRAAFDRSFKECAGR